MVAADTSGGNDGFLAGSCTGVSRQCCLARRSGVFVNDRAGCRVSEMFFRRGRPGLDEESGKSGFCNTIEDHSDFVD